MITRFISDLHLSADRPDITGLFVTFLRTEARESDALYILGDLFDYWIGDDDQNPFHRHVIQELKQLTDSGVPCYFIAGNRDFLIGERFASETGIVLLNEPHVADIYGLPTLLLHGDSLCTDDASYQRFRKIIRNPLLLAIAKRLPLKWRRSLAHKLRSGSKSNKPLSPEQLKLMDTTETAVQNAFAAYKVERIIHGHTHQPDIHEHKLSNGQLGTRIVLGDWYEQGSILEVTADTFILRNEPFSDE